MKKIFVNQKLIFTAVIALTALLCTQESMTLIRNRSNWQEVNGLVGLPLFNGTQEEGTVDYMIDGPIDIVKNFSNDDLLVTIHNSGTLCFKTTKNVPAHTMMQIPSKCDRNNTTNIDVSGPLGKKSVRIEPQQEDLPRIFRIMVIGQVNKPELTKQNQKQQLNSDTHYVILQK